jgi:hypothetical protein
MRTATASTTVGGAAAATGCFAGVGEAVATGDWLRPNQYAPAPIAAANRVAANHRKLFFIAAFIDWFDTDRKAKSKH